jgi:hypothetical protein
MAGRVHCDKTVDGSRLTEFFMSLSDNLEVQGPASQCGRKASTLARCSSVFPVVILLRFVCTDGMRLKSEHGTSQIGKEYIVQPSVSHHNLSWNFPKIATPSRRRYGPPDPLPEGSLAPKTWPETWVPKRKKAPWRFKAF